MFDDVLIESAGKDKKKGGWVTALISAVIHVALVGAIIAVAHGLGLRVVAEGIETATQKLILHGLGCDQGQGYLLGRPAAPWTPIAPAAVSAIAGMAPPRSRGSPRNSRMN